MYYSQNASIRYSNYVNRMNCYTSPSIIQIRVVQSSQKFRLPLFKVQAISKYVFRTYVYINYMET